MRLTEESQRSGLNRRPLVSPDCTPRRISRRSITLGTASRGVKRARAAGFGAETVPKAFLATLLLTIAAGVGAKGAA